METIGEIKQKVDNARRKFDYSFSSSSSDNSFDAGSEHEHEKVQSEPQVNENIDKKLRTVQEITGETSSEEEDFY